MSAKYIYRLSDENPDPHKQIGCMSGIFQLFDCHHFLGGSRRLIGQNQKRLPLGPNSNHGMDPKGASKKTTEKNHKKFMTEKQGISTESSRTSFSSSSCSSSISSLEYSKAPQLEPSPFSQTVVPENHAQHSPVYKQNPLVLSSRQSLDLQDIVKDSIYREARGISVKTATKGEARGQTLKYIDSPRPLQQPNSINPKASSLKESFCVLHKLREASSKSNEGKNGSATSAIKDARRFSCDGRESREIFKSTIKLKELPRLSLDGRAGSIRGSTSEMKSNYLLGDLGMGNEYSDNFVNQQQQQPGSNSRPSSVVAKLMGLETLQNPISPNGNQTAQIKTHLDVRNDPFSESSRTTDESTQNRISGSPRNTHKKSTSHRLRNTDTAKKPTASSKFPIEPASWRQPDGTRGSQTPCSKNRVALTKAHKSSLSIYGEIEKRSAQLEFKRSGRDLKALKQIFEKMQKTKEILENRDEASGFVTQTSSNSNFEQSSKLSNQQNLQNSSLISTTAKGTSSPKNFKSSIVIMKPAKLDRKPSNPTSSGKPTEGLSGGLHRVRVGASADGRMESVDRRAAKDVTPRTNHLREPSSQTFRSTDKSTCIRSIRLPRTSKELHSTARENTNSGMSSGSMNPRQQQTKLELEKQSHLTNLSSDSNRSRRQPNRQLTESGSPRRKPRPKSPNLQPSDDDCSDFSSDAWDLGHQGDIISQQSESNISLASQVDEEVSRTDRYDKINRNFIQQAHWRQKNLAQRSTKGISVVEPVQASSEQPSPVSVLDAAFYSDELPSPIKKKSISFKSDDEALNSDDLERILEDVNHSSSSTISSINTVTNQKKVKDIQTLIQNLKLPANEEPMANEIKAFYNSENADHRYISQIFFASGFQKDFEAGCTTMLFHATGYPINPNLFLPLEKAIASTGNINNKHSSKKIAWSEPHAKIQRKLIFDVVNEILERKLLSENSSRQWPSTNMLAGKRPRKKQLLGELCSEVDKLQHNSKCNVDDKDDSFKSILQEDLIQQSKHRTACHDEIPRLVLDVERLIFKDLINEVVAGEAIGQQEQSVRCCRHNFSQ